MFTREDARYRDLELTLATHAYRGRSIGSEATCHAFPGYGFCFDIGGASLSSTPIPRVFITHGHDDHIGGLIKHGLRRHSWGLEPATYYLPEWLVGPVRDWVQAQRRISGDRGEGDGLMRIQPVSEGDEISVEGNDYFIRPFRSVHRIRCQGYSMWGRRKRLKPEYRDVPGPELGRLKKSGVAIDAVVEVPEIAFPGDTGIGILDTAAGEIVRKARLLLLECTFVDDEVSPREALRTGHIHIDDIVAAARDGAFENEVILLTHFSARYTPDYVREHVAKKLSGEGVWPRIKLLLPEPRR